MLNMSPETIIKGKDDSSFATLDAMLKGEYDTSKARSKGYVTAANGSIYDQSFEGVLPSTMRYLMDERNAVKGAMKNKDRELQALKKSIEENTSFNGLSFIEMKSLEHKLKEEISMMDATQLALKILANSK